MSQKSDPPVLFVSYLWSSYSLIFNIFIWVAGYQSPTDGCKPVNNTFIPISGAEEFWQTLFRSISIFVRWPKFFQSFQREDLGGWISQPVQSLTPGWMEPSPVSHTTRPSVKADPLHPQHHPHHHLPNHHLTQEVSPDSALHARYHQHRTVARLEEGKMWWLIFKWWTVCSKK